MNHRKIQRARLDEEMMAVAYLHNKREGLVLGPE
jgi:hypothetical protein